MPSFACKDIGMSDNFEVKTESQEELMKIVETHAKTSHNIDKVSPDMKDKIQKAIKK